MRRAAASADGCVVSTTTIKKRGVMSNQRVFPARSLPLAILGILPLVAFACSGAHSLGASVTTSPDAATAAQGDDAGNPIILPVGAGVAAESSTPDGSSVDGGEAALEAAPAAPVCLAPGLACDGGCFTNDVNNCGACGSTCPAPPNATAACNMASGTYSCGWACNSGFTMCGGACLASASFATDPQNCGSCGYGCMSGVCVAGQCQAWSVAEGNLLIAGGDPAGGRVAMATDGTNLVWLDQYGQPFEAPVAGGSPMALSPPPASTVTPGAIAIANGVVAWTVSDPTIGITVWMATSNVTNSGARLNQLGDTSQVPRGLGLNAGGTAAFFLEDSSSDANLYELNLGSAAYFSSLAPSAPGAAGSLYDDIAVTPNYLFWTESINGNVMRYALANGAKTAVATGQGSPYRLAVDATNVYWASAGPNSTFTVSWTSQAAPAAPTVIPAISGWPLGLAADGTNVYFAALTSGVYELAYVGIGGGTPTQLASGGDGLFGVVVGGGAMFWFDDGDSTIHGRRLL